MTTKYQKPIEIQGVQLGTARALLTHEDLDAAATSQTFTLTALVAAHVQGAEAVPANAQILGAAIVRLEDFAGGSSSAVVVDLGDAGDPDELVDAADVFTGAKAAEALSFANGTYSLGDFEAAYAPQVVVTATGDNVDALTAGRVEVEIFYRAYSTAARVRD